ncbi:hypothetical protein FACS189419_00240 [Planctomycetales bacterium]|nr:hypothetical protein FACS189419_00240 [Planctomycetales bacterium]
MNKQTYDGAIVFMKVGTHSGENFDSIIKRKIQEIENTGMSFWGYGGWTCHPTKQVQPFAKEVVQKQGEIYLLMETIESGHSVQKLSKEYSEDKKNWKPIPKGISVTGSNYAIVLDEIVDERSSILFGTYVVAIGNSKGKRATDYIKGQCSKGCLEIADGDHIDSTEKVISYKARMKAPYAVFVR